LGHGKKWALKKKDPIFLAIQSLFGGRMEGNRLRKDKKPFQRHACKVRAGRIG
jgi:hypothetical protein